MCLLTDDWSPVMVSKDKGLLRPMVQVGHYKMVMWRQRIFKHPAVSNYAIIKECVTINSHCWTSGAFFHLNYHFFHLRHQKISLFNVNLTCSEILFLPSLCCDFFCAATWARNQLSIHSDPGHCTFLPSPHFTLPCQNQLSPTHSFTLAHERRPCLLRREFHKGLIVSLYSVSHQWLLSAFISFEARKPVGEGQFEYMQCRFKL